MKVVICSAARSPIGSFGGSLASVSAADLGATVAAEAIKRANLKPEQIDEVILGNVLQAGLGQNVARQITLKAGIPVEVPAETLNIVCGSGLRSVGLAAQMIKAGDAQIVLAGGSESMSNAPYAIGGHRFGVKMGNDKMIDVMINDGLWDAFNNYHMGMTAENIAEQEGITREMQDELSYNSQMRAVAAIEAGKFKEEIVPIAIPQRKGDPKIFDTDEFPRAATTLEGLAKLKPAFKKDGSVTAGNASGINDGAAMLVVASEDKAKELGLPILAEIVSYASAGVDPSIMGMGVVPATELALKKAGMTIEDIDVAEANEAFASQAVAVTRNLGLTMDKTNVNGGAVALGHPIGASGARILTTLLYELKHSEKNVGLATLCIGGGMGTAMIVRRG